MRNQIYSNTMSNDRINRKCIKLDKKATSNKAKQNNTKKKK